MAHILNKLLLAFSVVLIFTTSAYATDYCAHANVQGCWRFTEGSGTSVEDESSNTNDGTFKASGEPAWDSSVPTGYSNNSVLGDGVNDNIECGTDSSLDFVGNNEDFTVVFWIDDNGTGTFDRVLYRGSSGGDGWAVVTGDPSSRLGLLIEEGGNQDLAYASPSISSWTHIAFVFDYSEYPGAPAVIMYVDGSVVGDSNVSGVYGWASTNFAMLARDDEAGAAKVYLAEIAAFNTVLNETQINDIMDNGLKPGAAARRFFTTM